MNPIEVYKGKYICYSLGNFSFAGNGRPDDMDTYIFQQRFRVYPDGTAENADMRIIPCSISSQENVNDFKPTPKDADGAAALLARLDKLNAQFEKAFAKMGVDRRFAVSDGLDLRLLNDIQKQAHDCAPVGKRIMRLLSISIIEQKQMLHKTRARNARPTKRRNLL